MIVPKALSILLTKAGIPAENIPDDLMIHDIQTDSRAVRAGSLFIAYAGLKQDAHKYIPQAIANGAAAVIAEKDLPGLATPLLVVGDGRMAWAKLCAAWYGFPSRAMRLAGITGTDGKTTTANLLQHILLQNGTPTGLISTICARIGTENIDTGLHTSTPPPDQVQALLNHMQEQGCTAAILEATSEGLAQSRLAACDFDLALITNITHDHFYYHGSFEAYREAKATLFQYLERSYTKPGIEKIGVLNRDDAAYDFLAAIPGFRSISYGQGDADCRISSFIAGENSSRFALSTPWGQTTIVSPLLGLFNAYNIAAAVAAACAWGVTIDKAADAVAHFSGVPGRTQFIRQGQPFKVIVDFAHTANALEQVLRSVRQFTERKLIVVFGCAGERDTLKREPMGRAAATYADYAIFTAEDPRHENIHDILRQMVIGAEAAGGQEGVNYQLEPERDQAIAAALRMAAPGDTVIICGKGHEQSMCYGDEERPWDDRLQTVAALQSLGYNS